MKRVDLYLLKSNAYSDQIDFCCRLTEKAFALKQTIHILTEDNLQSDALNEALWAFKAESFLPHGLGQKNHAEFPITIDSEALEENDEVRRNLLILLSTKLKGEVKNFDRMCVIVPNRENEIQQARLQYKHLKQQGIEVFIHDRR